MPKKKAKKKARKKAKKAAKKVVATTHIAAKRKNIPTVEYAPLLDEEDKRAIRLAYERRNRDFDPQLIWRGKDEQDLSALAVDAPPLYIQEKIQPKVLIDDLRRMSGQDEDAARGAVGDLFADFNGLPDANARTEFYQHEANWSNRMILGDSLQVMAALAEREGLRGKVQCIYLDPPYGIKFNSNFQWSTTSREVKDGKVEHITREPEQVKAFRDTWRDGIHSYLAYLRDRLTVARDLLSESGSIFVQIGDENVHRVRALMDEVFGEENFISQITYKVTSGFERTHGPRRVQNYILWHSKVRESCKFRRLYLDKSITDLDLSLYKYAETESELRTLTAEEKRNPSLIPHDAKIFRTLPLHTMGTGKREQRIFENKSYLPPANTQWRHTESTFEMLRKAGRIVVEGNRICSKLNINDFPNSEYSNVWMDTGPELSKFYVVQTSAKVIQRCLLMSTDPGDLVLDPTCGSGTTAYVAEQWGRRWITIDTSRVALALARARIMGARYPYYLLADSSEGAAKEAALCGKPPSTAPVTHNIRLGFVYERVPHITLKAIANNTEIDSIWAQWQQTLEPLRAQLNAALDEHWQEWEIPRAAEDGWPEAARQHHAAWWRARRARQQAIDESIAVRAEFEYLYDRPVEDNRAVRVAGPFTVESISPHRTLAVGTDDELIDPAAGAQAPAQDFTAMILAHLQTAGVQQTDKQGRIAFSALEAWPGRWVCAEGIYQDAGQDAARQGGQRRAGVFIGPEFGTVARQDLAAAAREAAEAGFDDLIACAFNYDASATELNRLGRVPVLKARINADLHMAGDLANTGKGNLFVIFGEPDIDLLAADDGRIQVRINGVDVFDPGKRQVKSHDTDGIACWFIDTDYNEESFFIRQAYFLGANDPYKQLKTTLKSEINEAAWQSLHSAISRPFDKPEGGRIAVKVINHLGDEVMKVYEVG